MRAHCSARRALECALLREARPQTARPTRINRSAAPRLHASRTPPPARPKGRREQDALCADHQESVCTQRGVEGARRTHRAPPPTLHSARSHLASHGCASASRAVGRRAGSSCSSVSRKALKPSFIAGEQFGEIVCAGYKHVRTWRCTRRIDFVRAPLGGKVEDVAVKHLTHSAAARMQHARGQHPLHRSAE